MNQAIQVKDLREHGKAIRRHHAQCEKIEARINNMHIDKYDGEISDQYFRERESEWREEQERCIRDIEYHEKALQSHRIDGIRIAEVAGKLPQLFKIAPPHVKRRLLNLLFEKRTWRDARLFCKFRHPFNLVAKSDVTDASRPATGASVGRISDKPPFAT